MPRMLYRMDAAALYQVSEQKKGRNNVGEDYNFHLECSFLSGYIRVELSRKS